MDGRRRQLIYKRRVPKIELQTIIFDRPEDIQGMYPGAPGR